MSADHKWSISEPSYKGQNGDETNRRDARASRQTGLFQSEATKVKKARETNKAKL
jgi:hypothetical protein